MATIYEVLALWEAVDVSAIAQEVIEENEQAIVQANQEQMELGLTSDGKKIGWYSGLSYAKFKHDMNPLPPFRVPDLHLTGAFYSRMRAFPITAGTVSITSDDQKTHDLEEKYGGDIFGLQEESAIDVSENVIMPSFREKFKKQVGQ